MIVSDLARNPEDRFSHNEAHILIIMEHDGICFLFFLFEFHLISGNEHGRAFRDLELESEIHKLTQKMGIGAQFGGKYFCHDVRVVRLPRHGASCPVGIGVSCSADRQVGVWKIT